MTKNFTRRVTDEEYTTQLRIVALLRGVADWLENQSGPVLRTTLPAFHQLTADLEAIVMLKRTNSARQS